MAMIAPTIAASSVVWDAARNERSILSVSMGKALRYESDE